MLFLEIQQWKCLTDSHICFGIGMPKSNTWSMPKFITWLDGSWCLGAEQTADALTFFSWQLMKNRRKFRSILWNWWTFLYNTRRNSHQICWDWRVVSTSRYEFEVTAWAHSAQQVLFNRVWYIGLIQEKVTKQVHIITSIGCLKKYKLEKLSLLIATLMPIGLSFGLDPDLTRQQKITELFKVRPWTDDEFAGVHACWQIGLSLSEMSGAN